MFVLEHNFSGKLFQSLDDKKKCPAASKWWNYDYVARLGKHPVSGKIDFWSTSKNYTKYQVIYWFESNPRWMCQGWAVRKIETDINKSQSILFQRQDL